MLKSFTAPIMTQKSAMKVLLILLIQIKADTVYSAHASPGDVGIRVTLITLGVRT